jgi:hypothetical protein
MFVETECGLVIKPFPSPDEEFGSLKAFVKGKTSRQLLEEARKGEFAKDAELRKRLRAANFSF